MRRDLPIEALWRYSIPFGAPEGGQHFVIPETTLNIVFYRTFCRAGTNSNEHIFLLGQVSTTTSFALAPGHELIAARIKPEWATYLLGIAPEDVGRVMRYHADYISQETLSERLVDGEPDSDARSETQKVEGMEVTLGVRKV